MTERRRYGLQVGRRYLYRDGWRLGIGLAPTTPNGLNESTKDANGPGIERSERNYGKHPSEVAAHIASLPAREQSAMVGREPLPSRGPFCGNCSLRVEECTCSTIEVPLEVQSLHFYKRLLVLESALEEIAKRPTFERNPDGVDQAAATMQMIAREALDGD